jgi:hypothetical protein
MLCSLNDPPSTLLPTLLADPVNLEGVAGGAVVVAAADVFFEFPDFVGKEFDRAAAIGADHVVVAAAIVLVLITRDAVVEGDFTGEVALGEQLQGAVDGGVADPGIFLFHETMELVRGEVLTGLQKRLQDRVALGRVLQADTLEVLVQDTLRFADHLGGDGGLVVNALV